MDKAIDALLEIEPCVTDATGAAAVLEVLNEHLFTKKPDGGRWTLSAVEVDALRHAIRTTNSAIDMIDGVHRGVLEKVRSSMRTVEAA